MEALIASRYRILRELGRGGMGAVYLVEHIHTGEQLALKLLHAQAGADAATVERFRREARASARIKSENVVRVTDADVAPELDGAPFLVMEHLNGCDLEQWVERQGPLPPDQVASWLSDVARALDKAHSLGIVHRDLKPENLFLHYREDGSQIIKILDFGIAKSRTGELGTGGDVSVTKSGAVFGTPLYMSPEQALGQQDAVSGATDQWAMALIAYFLLTGQVYFTGESFTALVVQIVAEPLVLPSQRSPALPAEFDNWFFRSCERNPAARFPGVSEQAAALRIALGAEPPQADAAVAPAPAVEQGARLALATPAHLAPGASTEGADANPAASAVLDLSAPEAPVLHSTATALSHSSSPSDFEPQAKPSRTSKLIAGLVVGLSAMGLLIFGATQLSNSSSAELTKPEGGSRAQAVEAGSATTSQTSEPQPGASDEPQILPAEAPSAAALPSGSNTAPRRAPNSAPTVHPQTQTKPLNSKPGATAKKPGAPTPTATPAASAQKPAELPTAKPTARPTSKPTPYSPEAP